ncbi:MAG TPA: bifunctional hydroxymethylpyrimidine kinase/phosphomethylpyrimidine kinase [Bryobacteraceae bacterium]|nr:bifunctional hydroxymethylpyrimidine kinase/phosphomethylpyrimidine kinase [Bryobacteraceae bacterium]
MPAVALSIAGSDPSGGAGIQADLKTFHQLGVYGEAAITLLTVQNSLGISRVEVMDGELVRQQIAAVLQDIPPAAAKTGALGSLEVVEAVAALAASFRFPLVVDPVMIGKHGSQLLSADAVQALRERLIPRATVVTPNLPEAEALTGMRATSPADINRMARRLCEMGARAAIVKGGHASGEPVDLLFDGDRFYEFHSPRLETRHTHGTGCTHSAALTAYLARGLSLIEAAAKAKEFIFEAIKTNPGLGAGCGPVNHHCYPGGS